jgi:outer membrane lipoprotein-sorting protein
MAVMRIPRAVSMAVLAMAAGLTGCFSSTHAVQKTQAPETYRTASVEQLGKELADRDAAIKTLNAQVLVTASTGGSRTGTVTEYTSFRGYIFVQKPASLRVILQVPVLGSRALDMVSDGKQFTLVRASKTLGDIWMQGSNQVTKPSKNGLENLRPPVFLDSLLVPGVQPGEFVNLTESTRVLQEASKHHDAIEEPDYDLTVLKAKSGNILQRERTIHISRVTMLPFQQDIYDDDGQIVTQALYDKYQQSAGQMFPALITIKRPVDEYSLKIEVTKLTLNETFDADQFELKIPAGVAVKKME